MNFISVSYLLFFIYISTEWNPPAVTADSGLTRDYLLKEIRWRPRRKGLGCSWQAREGNLRLGLNNCTGAADQDFLWARDSVTGEEIYWLGHEQLNQTTLDLPVNKSSCLVVEGLDLATGELERDLGQGWADQGPGKNNLRGLEEEELPKASAPEREFIGLLVVTDNLRLEALGGDKDKLKSSTVNIISLLQDIYEDFGPPGQYQIRIELDQVQHRQGKELPWETAVRAGNYFSPETILLMFASWARDEGLLKTYNTVMLLTGSPLYGSVVGIASLGTYCRGGVGIVESLYSDPAVAKTLAHELGHTLGIRHTTNYVQGTSLDTADKVLACTRQTTSVMSPMIMSTAYVWDTCSVDWFQMYMRGYPPGCGQAQAGSGPCTYWPGYRPGCMDSRNPTCGNTVVDPGEQCDCGSESECTDPCCNPKTCQLRGSCSAVDSPCCDPETCEPFPGAARHVCRVPEPGNSCQEDQGPMYCSGESLDCPEDYSQTDYQPCTAAMGIQKPGQCYQGQCVSHAISCERVKLAQPGMQADIRGPCIRAQYGDVACRDLYCEYGQSGYCTSFSQPSKIQVPEGTSCGPGRICLQQLCVLQPGSGGGPTDSGQPTAMPTAQPGPNPGRTRAPGRRLPKRCVWRNQRRICRWKRGERPVEFTL